MLLAISLAGVPALLVLARQSAPARVLSKEERIQVLASTGQWYHEYMLRVGVRRGNVDDDAANDAAIDSFVVAVGRDQFDATRVGARTKLNYLAFLPKHSWMSDSTSAIRTVASIIEPHLKYYHHPAPVSPLQAQMAGLARVVSVRSVQRRSFFWQKTKSGGDASQWMHLVEVEFWAQRVRTLVRTIDVIDAGSIPGLHAGDIVQMHFDPRDPRVLRLDDGRRTFARNRL